MNNQARLEPIYELPSTMMPVSDKANPEAFAQGLCTIENPFNAMLSSPSSSSSTSSSSSSSSLTSVNPIPELLTPKGPTAMATVSPSFIDLSVSRQVAVPVPSISNAVTSGVRSLILAAATVTGMAALGAGVLTGFLLGLAGPETKSILMVTLLEWFSDSAGPFLTKTAPKMLEATPKATHPTSPNPHYNNTLNYQPLNSFAPQPGFSYVIQDAGSGKVITLLEGQVILASPGTGSAIWVCEKKGGWLGFRDHISGKYLGYGFFGGLRCTATSHKYWENFLLDGAVNPDGSFGLLTTHWYDLVHVGADGENGLRKMGNADSGHGIAWRFIGAWSSNA